MRIVSHQPFSGYEQALTLNADVESNSEIVSVYKKRIMVSDTDTARQINEQINDLRLLLEAYRSGELVPKT